MKDDRLHAVPLFAELRRHDLEAVSRLADELDIPEGRVLARQGDLGHEFFVIERGTAVVERDGEEIARLGPGDFFGEIALIEADRRTATVTAAEPMEVIVMTGSAFRSLKRSLPKVYDRVSEEVHRRRGVSA